MASSLSDENEVRVVLLGNTGSGKSSLARNIAESNADNIFNAGHGTLVVKQILVNRSDLNLSIIDTPGYKNKDDANYEKNLAACLDKTRPGPHIFLMCISAGRCTKEINEMLEKHVKFFGEKINRFTIFIFTRIDQWKEDMEELGCDTDFQRYIDSLPVAIKKFSPIGAKRYCGINNRLTGAENEQQIKQLIDSISKLVSLNKRECFEKEIETTVLQKAGSCISYMFPSLKWSRPKNHQNNNQ